MWMNFSAANGSVTTDLRLVVLFRDNVQHHLQGGLPGPDFPQLHELADAALEGRSLRVAAAPLFLECARGWRGIERVDVRDVAISLRTRAAVTQKLGPPAVRGTVLLRQAGWPLPVATGGARTLGALFADLHEKLRSIATSAAPGELVEVAPSRGLAPHALWLP